jgi:hypothetical protein
MGIETAIIGAAIVGMGALKASGEAKAGKQAGNAQADAILRQSEYNAQIYDQQAQMVLEQKKIKDQQFLRQRKRTEGSIIAGAAGRGFMFSGTPLAVLADTEAQMGFDQAIEQYNLDVNRNYLLSSANMTRYQGQQQSSLVRSEAKSKGNAQAFSTILNTAMMAAAL